MQNESCQEQLRTSNNGSAILNYIDAVLGTIHVASMDEFYLTYADDEHADSHHHDANTDDELILHVTVAPGVPVVLSVGS